MSGRFDQVRILAPEKGPRSGERGRACLGRLPGQRKQRATPLCARGFALAEHVPAPMSSSCGTWIRSEKALYRRATR